MRLFIGICFLMVCTVETKGQSPYECIKDSTSYMPSQRSIWIEISNDEYFNTKIDINNTTKSSDDIVSVFFLVQASSAEVLKELNDTFSKRSITPNEKYQYYAYDIFLLEIDCQLKNSRHKECYSCSETNTLINLYKSKEIYPITDNSNMQHIYNRVCNINP